MKKGTIFMVTILSVILLAGCYPNGAEYTEDMDIVLTKHNEAYDFTTKGTYAMNDSIVKITGNVQEGEKPDFIPQVTAAQILARIDANMAALGYTKVPLSKVDPKPDLLLLPSSWETTTIYYYYDYWYGWWGGYYPYWGYPPVYAGSYTTGTLLMTLIDPEDIGANGNPIVEWTGALNGILTDKYNPARVNPLIDQAFNQSPYLKTN
jgi:hypothetical protein